MKFRAFHRPLAMAFALLIGTALPARAGEEAALPPDVPALPADLTNRMKNLIQQAEKFRGLKCLHAVPCGALGEEGLRKKMRTMIAEELPPKKMRPLEISLKVFGFIPQDMNLEKYFPELLTSQVGGFYDPRRKFMVLVQKDGGVLGKEGREKYGAALADRMEETVLVHELVHALQDQHFNLAKFAIDDPMSDEGSARTGLIEGDATLAMYNFFSGMQLEKLPFVEKMMNDMFKDPKQLIEMSPDMPGAKEMADAPAWFRDNLLFSYMQGFVFCLNIKRLGGQKLLDHAFLKDPPRSTEQILHPEKWHTQRDDPIVIAWPDLSKALPGYTKVNEGQLGEQSIKVLLRDKLKDDGKAVMGAAGWGGDRFAVYEKGGKHSLLWLTEWDSAEDAKEFSVLAKELGADWTIDHSQPKRVNVFRAKLTEAELAAAKTALNDVKTQAPENKKIDLAAITGGGRAQEKDPNADLLSENDLNVDDLLKKFGDGIGGKEKIGGIDLAELAKNPEMQAMLKKMLTEKRPQGKLSDDGRGYANEQLGFEFRLPDTRKDWILNAKPPVPMAAVMATSPDGTVQVSIVTQTLPLALDIGMMGPMLEMGPKMAFKNYKKINAGPIELNGKKGYELEYEGEAQGQTLRTRQRMFTMGSTMLVVAAASHPDDWARNEKAIDEIMKGFKLTEPKAVEPKVEEKK